MESWEHYARDFNYGFFKDIEPLQRGGLNFRFWNQCLRDVLQRNGLLHVIDSPLRFPPGPGASAADHDDYQEVCDHYRLVEDMMLSAVVPHLREWLKHFDASQMYMVILALNRHHVRMMAYECKKEFYSMKMEENGHIYSHVMKMYGLWKRLTTELSGRISDEIAMNVVLLSLPKSYKDVIARFLRDRDDHVPFFDFMMWLRNQKVDSTAGEVIDG